MQIGASPSVSERDLCSFSVAVLEETGSGQALAHVLTRGGDAVDGSGSSSVFVEEYGRSWGCG